MILTLLTLALVPGIIVGGEAYKQIVAGRDFEQSAISPSLYIIEIHSRVQAMALAAEQGASTDDLRSDVSAREAAYEKAHTYWAAQLRDGQARSELETSYRDAESYFNLDPEAFLAGLQSRRQSDAAAVLNGPMTAALNGHRQALPAGRHESRTR